MKLLDYFKFSNWLNLGVNRAREIDVNRAREIDVNIAKELLKEKPLVNYIWINSRKTNPRPNAPVCSIDLANIECAIINANKYPEAEFRIWVDRELLDDYSIFCMESLLGNKSQFGNITLHDLQDIPDYANDEYFVPLKKSFFRREFSRSADRNVYSRADYARILILDHCMQTLPDQNQIIYSDIDCQDVRLSETLLVMDRGGVVIHDMGSFCVSHGYIGITPCNDNIKKHFKELKSKSRSAAHNNDLGFMAFDNFLLKLGMPNSTWHHKIGLKKLLPSIGCKLKSISYTPLERFDVWKKLSTSEFRSYCRPKDHTELATYELMVSDSTEDIEDTYDWACTAAPSLDFDIAAKREAVDPKEYDEYEATYSQQPAAFGG